MANRTGKKGKKPLQTTLGKAACHNEKDVDLSHIQKPINTSVFGLRQVLSLFQTATQEVQNYITYECDIMYECRICRTIFRSLANFILHKRDYCREQFNHFDLLNNNDEISEFNCEEDREDMFNKESRPMPSESEPKEGPPNAGARKGLNPVIERLKEKQEIIKLAQEVLSQDLSSKEVEDSNESTSEKSRADDLFLEEIATNNAAVFQTVLRNLPEWDSKKPEFMKSEVMEIHGILDSDEAVLGPDGKICTFKTNRINENPIIPKNILFCTECNLRFSTRKTLRHHIKYKHNNSRLVYVCPDCKETFANAWCVYRHLIKIHRKTSIQIRRMRDQIHNSCIREDQAPVKKKKTLEKIDKPDEENQWLSNIEGDNDLQMCGGCGKRFERKAALHSHAQMCTKRIAVCNTIKDNAKKKEEELCKDLKNKSAKAEKIEVLKGSSKRKPNVLRTYKSFEEDSQDKETVSSGEESEDNCDVNAYCEIEENNSDNNKDTSEEETGTLNNERNSISSSEDLLSPSKKDFVSSPSIEKIDTERMFNIIGITANYEHVKNVNESDVHHTDTDENPKSTQDISKQNDPLEGEPEGMEAPPHKTPKTIPLILRRKSNSSKSVNGNGSLENPREAKVQSESLKENQPETDKELFVDDEDVAQVGDSNIDNTSSSTFKISVKSLEDLIGVSPQTHIQSLENKEANETTDSELQTRYNEFDHPQLPTETNVAENSDISEITELSIPLENLSERYPKCLKRKRTSSFDVSECRKLSRLSKGILFPKKRDVTFISKASPFMDQNKLLCKACQISYPTLSKLLWHMSAHFSWFRFQCSRCSFISFNKVDCANHARRAHGVRRNSIQSVVLPIPNWKTVLMSHDFCTLDDESDLSGRHTDEVLSGNLEETDVDDEEDSNEKLQSDAYEEPDWPSRLFVESTNGESEPENDPLEPDVPLRRPPNMKQENIDVSDDVGESFQVEVPQELYTFDVSEISPETNYERHNYVPQIKTENLDDEEYITLNNYFPTHQENEIFVDQINIETGVILDEETNETLFNEGNEEVNNLENQECCEQDAEQSINIRPIRNRTRSIKTIQEDFFYDLSKVIKLNDTSLSRSNQQKQKKLASQKNKDSASSDGKNSQRIRVYSKRK